MLCFTLGGIKGIVGLPTNFVGGALGMVSKNLEGIHGSINHITNQNQIKKERRRLPRCIQGDNAIRSYSQGDAVGSHVLRNYYRNSNVFSQVMGNARSYQAYRHDRYEESMLLRGQEKEYSRLVMITNQRIIGFLLPTGCRPQTDDIRQIDIEKVKGRVEKEFQVPWTDFLSADVV